MCLICLNLIECIRFLIHKSLIMDSLLYEIEHFLNCQLFEELDLMPISGLNTLSHHGEQRSSRKRDAYKASEPSPLKGNFVMQALNRRTGSEVEASTIQFAAKMKSKNLLSERRSLIDKKIPKQEPKNSSALSISNGTLASSRRRINIPSKFRYQLNQKANNPENIRYMSSNLIKSSLEDRLKNVDLRFNEEIQADGKDSNKENCIPYFGKSWATESDEDQMFNSQVGKDNFIYKLIDFEESLDEIDEEEEPQRNSKLFKDTLSNQYVINNFDSLFVQNKIENSIPQDFFIDQKVYASDHFPFRG